MEESLILIPARGGSKGIPGKNMAPIGGRPLVEFTIRAAMEAGLPGRICLSTDDERIRDFGLSLGVEAPFLRPPELSGDDVGMLPVISHALEWYERKEGFSPSYIVLLQPTSPFRTAQNIREAVALMEKERAESLIAVCPVKEHPSEYVIRGDGGFSFVMEPPSRPGRQNFKPVFFISGAIYIARAGFFKKTGRLYDGRAALYVMKRSESLDVDDPLDLGYANWFYEKVKMGAEGL